MEISELKAACSGRWFNILSNFGIEVQDNGKHSACPICKDGVDRFRMERDGSGYYCNQCNKHAGDTLQLIQRVFGWSFSETIERISQTIGGVRMDTPQASNKMSIPDIKAMLNKIWLNSKPLTGSDHASRYLHDRGLVLQPDNVRFSSACYESDSKTTFPAMVARVVTSTGQPIALHRIYLDPAVPKKAEIESPKKLTPALDSLVGCAVRLFPIKDKTIGLAEGIETAISCNQIFDIPTWATISTSIMEGFIPPEGIRRIIIFADNDPNFAGAKSAYILANKLYNKDYLVEVRMPEGISTDFNDELWRTIK